MGCIYVVRNRVNGKYYVGKTSETMKKRRSVHEALAKRNQPKTAFHRALKKYGFESFSWYIVDEEDDEGILNYLERYAIAFLDSQAPNGYNITQGGDGAAGFVRSAKDRQRKSEAAKRQWQSKEHRRKMSERAQRWWKNPKNAEKVRRIMEAASTARKGKPSCMKGKKHSSESKRKMREARSKYITVQDASGRFTSTIVWLVE